ncbi:MAG TPA: polyprenyl synthetase family protein [Oligoflexia bacterium]|nr:polyprenyl synthetase family protein [Oligoflexia bacterium]HMP27432.1 polyprenyl synthetase family protein [Oligoflexia bacterium]
MKWSEYRGSFLERFRVVEDLYFASLNLELEINQAIKYILEGGGKLLRPKLVTAIAIDLGMGPTPEILSLALAVEMAHVSTLVHDDLPALDNDDLRRGRPTCHKVFSEGIALLAGDKLIADALCLILQLDLEGDLKAQAAQILSKAYSDIALGQMLDLKGHDYLKTACHKTGALFGAALRMPALFAGCGAGAIQQLALVGEDLGVCFQLQNDFLDRYGQSGDIGRPIGSDQRNKRENPFSYETQLERGIDLFSKFFESLKCKIEVVEKNILRRGEKLFATREIIAESLSQFKPVQVIL